MDRQDADGGIEGRGPDVELAGVTHPVIDRQPVGAVAPACGLDQRRCGVDAGDARAGLRQRATEHSLAASDVENPRARCGLQQTQRARDDDVLVILAAALADQIVVPFGDVLPAR